MAIVQDWLPPSRENWEALCYVWQFFPLVRLRCDDQTKIRCRNGTQKIRRLIMCVCVGGVVDYGGAMGGGVVPAGQDVD